MMSEWTIATVKEYFDSLLDAYDQRYTQRFASAELAVKDALAAQEKAVTAAFLASEKAIVKAEDAQKDYNVRSNEFRGQLDDQNKMQMPRIEAMGLFRAMDDKISLHQKTMDDKLTALVLTFESKLEASKLSSEKVFDGIAKEIGGLRESRSLLDGSKTGQTDMRAWALAGIAVAGFVLNLIFG